MCPEYQRLMNSYGEAVRAFSEIMAKFHDARWKPGFQEVVRQAENAKLAAEAARVLLEHHILEHGCGAMPPAPQN